LHKLAKRIKVVLPLGPLITVIEFFYITAKFTTLLLLVFMSLIFSKPMNGYKKEFLLSYRKKSHGQVI